MTTITPTVDVKQVTQPSVLVFNLKTDELIKKFVLDENVLRDTSVLTSIVSTYTKLKHSLHIVHFGTYTLFLGNR